LRICYARDGKSVHDKRFLRYLADRGYEVHLLSFDRTSPDIDGVEVHRLPTLRRYGLPRPLRVPYDSRVFTKAVNRLRPDVLHGHYVTTYGFYAARSGYKPLLITPWGSDILLSPKRSRLMKRVARFVLKRADLVTADSMALKRGLLELGCEEEKIVYFPWGVELDRFFPRDDRVALRRELNLPDGIVVICNRWLRPVYGIEHLIKAVPVVLAEAPSTTFVIGGDGELRPRVEGLVRELGIGDSVKMVGSIPHEKMPHYLQAADVYVSPSLSDSTSVALLEAMACGLTPVVTDVDANLEWVTDGANGLIVPRGDERALATALIKVIKEDSIRMKFGKESYEAVRSRANWLDNMKVLESVYERLAS